MDLMESFCLKTRFRKTLAVQKSTDEENRGSPWRKQREIDLQAQILLNFCKTCHKRDFEAVELAAKSP